MTKWGCPLPAPKPTRPIGAVRRLNPPRRPRAQEIAERDEQHLACVATQHLGRQPVEVRAVAGAGRADHRREQCLVVAHARAAGRSEEHTSELQSLMRTSYAV